MAKANEQYRVMTITTTETDAETGAKSTYRREVYIVPPGKKFEGFGGSRAGLLVTHQPSLIVRDISGAGNRDSEHNVHDARTWNAIRLSIMAGGVVTA